MVKKLKRMRIIKKSVYKFDEIIFFFKNNIRGQERNTHTQHICVLMTSSSTFSKIKEQKINGEKYEENKIVCVLSSYIIKYSLFVLGGSVSLSSIFKPI